MRHDTVPAGKRKAVNLSIDAEVLAAARAAGINMSRVTERALRLATKHELEARWREENRDWIEAHNRWLEENGIPLSGLPAL
jgi:antitoxin CcdA